MAIGKVNRVNNISASTPVSNTTSISKNLQNQILAKQQNLKKLSTDSQLSVEEKEKQRQELQKEIEELERKLEQIQLKSKEAEKMEKEVEKVESEDEIEKAAEEKEYNREVFASKEKEDNQKNKEPIPVEDVQKILHHNLILKDEMVQQGVAYDKENTVRILLAEINQDEIRGLDTSAKEEEIKEIREKEIFWRDVKNKNNEIEKSKIVNPDMQVVIS